MSDAIYPGAYRSAIARSKRVLVEAGFPWSVTRGRYTPYFNEQTTTDGVRVTRVGCSKTVAIHWHKQYQWEREDMKWVIALAVATLREAGLPYDDRGWLECRYE